MIDLEVEYIKLKIDSIMESIKELKSENRSIGDKIRSFGKQIDINSEKTKSCTQEQSYVYLERIVRDYSTVEYLYRLQKINGKTIRKNRAKISSLKKEIENLEK